MILVHLCFDQKQLSTNFVRPHLENVHVDWSAFSQKLINMLWNGTNYKHSTVDVCVEIWLKFSSTSICMIKLWSQGSSNCNSKVSGTMGCQLVWRAPKVGLRGIQTNSFYYRVIKVWNELPSEVVNAPTVSAFKASLDSAWKNLSSKYNPTPIESGS